MTKVLTRGLRRAIANPLNRALWWLTAGVSTLTLLTGAIPATYLYLNTFSVPISKVIIWFLVLNSITLAVLLTLLAIVLSRVSYPLIGARAVGVSVCVATVAALVRLTMVWLTRFSESAPTSDAGVAFYIVQLALSLMLIITLAITVSFASAYASNRERALSRAIADFDRSQASLVREEEVVRSAVFDHLHGTLQSEFVAMREASTPSLNQPQARKPRGWHPTLSSAFVLCIAIASSRWPKECTLADLRPACRLL